MAWCFFHMARIEDITMNLLVARSQQVLSDDWLGVMKTQVRHSANAICPAAVEALSAELDLSGLRDYRRAVGQRTRTIAAGLQPEEMGRKPSAADLERIWEAGAVLPEAAGIVDYWSRRTVTGLLLMPPSRHLIIHLNEAAQIKQRLMR